jgi:ammonia channel protein AmtB
LPAQRADTRRVHLPYAIGSTVAPSGALIVGLALACVALRALQRFQRTPVSERKRRFHVHGISGLVTGVLAIVFALIALFPSTVHRSVVPAFEYEQVGRSSTSYVVTDTTGHRYVTNWFVFSRLRTGAAYTCQVHVYVAVLRPKLVSCTAASLGRAAHA